MHNLFLVQFVNLYMLRAYLGPSSGGTTVCIQQLVLIIILDDCRPGGFHSLHFRESIYFRGHFLDRHL